jgi:hypothetical protein
MTGIALEGCADFFFGRPLDCNPYVRETASDAWKAWREGWLAGSFFEDDRGDEERRRWLRQPVAV